MKKQDPDSCLKCSQALYFRTVVEQAQLATMLAMQTASSDMTEALKNLKETKPANTNFI